MDIGGWLRSLGLEQYEATFRKNAINEKVLPNLTAEDLKDMGVGIVGHRRMLLDAIALLRADGSAKRPPAEASSTTPKSAQDETTCLGRQATVLVWRLVKGRPWRRPENSQPSLRRMWLDTAGSPGPTRKVRWHGCGRSGAI
jgi:hypothetical protein